MGEILKSSRMRILKSAQVRILAVLPLMFSIKVIFFRKWIGKDYEVTLGFFVVAFPTALGLTGVTI